jgi:NADH-quinone oxidoreductase subunit C
MPENQPEHPIVTKLRVRFPDAVEETTSCAGIPTARIRKESLPAVCEFLRSDPELDFDYLSNLCGADYPQREKRFDVVYHIYSIRKGHKFSLVVQAAENEEVPSVTPLWPAADFQERETYDLYGIRFSGHPDLKRLFLPAWWEGHPLRKDYPIEGRGEEQKVVDECSRLSKPRS